MSWFYTRPIAAGCWLVAEPSQVNAFLVAGSDAAVAVETAKALLARRQGTVQAHERV